MSSLFRLLKSSSSESEGDKTARLFSWMVSNERQVPATAKRETVGMERLRVERQWCTKSVEQV